MFRRLNPRAPTLLPWQKTLYIVFTSQLVSVIGFASIFPFLPLYVQSLGSRSSLSIELLAGLVFSSQAATMMISSPIWGALADRFGRKVMIERATFGGGVIVLLMGFATSAEMLVVMRAVQGLITGTFPAANALVASSVPRDRVGYGMGLIQMSLWSGIAIGPLIGGLLADAFGYRLSFVLTAFLLFLAGVLVWRGVDEDFHPAEPADEEGWKLWGDWHHVLAEPGILIAFSLRFLIGLGNMIIFPIAPFFIVTLLPESAPVNFYTGLVIGVGGIASTLTTVSLGKMGDRIGHRIILLASTLAAALFYLPQALVTAAWQLLILQALTGAALGGTVTALTALLAQISTPGEEGSVYGLDSAIQAASRVVAPLIGAGVAYWFDLRATFGVTGVLFLFIFMLALWRLPGIKARASAS